MNLLTKDLARQIKPQRLKPYAFLAAYGTTEVVPRYESEPKAGLKRLLRKQ